MSKVIKQYNKPNPTKNIKRNIKPNLTLNPKGNKKLTGTQGTSVAKLNGKSKLIPTSGSKPKNNAIEIDTSGLMSLNEFFAKTETIIEERKEMIKRKEEIDNKINAREQALNDCRKQLENLGEKQESAKERLDVVELRAFQTTMNDKNLSLLEAELGKITKELENYICPLSHKIITRAVIASDGQSYDQDSIIAWIQNHPTSPLIDGVKLTIKNLIRNQKMEDRINFLMKRKEKLEDLMKKTNRTLGTAEINDIITEIKEDGLYEDTETLYNEPLQKTK